MTMRIRGSFDEDVGELVGVRQCSVRDPLGAPMEQAVVLSRAILVTMDLPPQCATQMKATTMLSGTPGLHEAPM